ncbi:hypothetical protein MMC26_004939 [Xylographa opegraphella]|nr:hypothetical protein [Xylographa opegraphella]
MADNGPEASPRTGSAKMDPVLRNAIRYTISAKEYRTLHEYLLKQSPTIVRSRAPLPSKYDAAIKNKDDYNAAAIRASLRVFLAAQLGLKLWDIVTEQLLRRSKPTRTTAKSAPFKSPNFRLSISISLILLLHRVLHRFFTRLRVNLLTKDAAPFRRRNPRISKALTARLAPAIGSSLAGFVLGVSPGDQFRISVAIYLATRAAEFAYNTLEDDGWFKNRPWWFGSWLLMPPVFGQLLHAFLFDRDCFPTSYGDFILKNTPNYIQKRPPGYPSQLAWPTNDGIVDGLAEISKLNYPAFVSPILFPSASQTLPSSISQISPITSSAHPSIRALTCALLHPQEPSCLRTYISFFLGAVPMFAKFFALILGLFSLPRYKMFLKDPVKEVDQLAKTVLRMTIFVSGAIGTSWGSICLFQYILPRTFLPTQRWFWGGFLGGFWGFLERKKGRSQFLYSTRTSIDSLWKVGVKRGWWKSGKNGDVWVFVASLMLLNAVYEVKPNAVTSGVVRKSLGMLRGEGWVDRARLVKNEGAQEE